MGLGEKHSPIYSNMHPVESSIHLSIVFTRLALKNTTKYPYDPQAPHTHKIGLCSFSDDRMSQEWQRWEESPIAFSSTIPSIALHFLNYLSFPKGNAEISQKGFLRRLAWISGSVPVDSRWIGLYQWSAQRSSQNRPQPDCPTLAQACPCTSPSKVPSSGAPAAGSAASESPPRWNAAAAGPPSPAPPPRKTRRNPSQRGSACRDGVRTRDRKSVV